MDFEWDEAKRKLNLIKHGVDFKDVYEVFDAPMTITFDARRAYGEDRWIGIGQLRGTTVVIVFTERGRESVRIISARRMKKHEKEKNSKRKNRF